MIMVGDAPSDIGMANNAKLLAGVAVLTNDIYLEKLRKETKVWKDMIQKLIKISMILIPMMRKVT